MPGFPARNPGGAYMAVLDRLRFVLRTEGMANAVRFVLGRLIRIRSHIVYCSCADGHLDVSWKQNELCLCAADAEQLEEVVRQGGPLPAGLGDYLDGVRKGEVIACFVLVDGVLAHWSFLMKRSRTLCLLGVPPGAVLLGNDFTRPEFRGRGLQTRGVLARLQQAREAGCSLAVSETEPDNVFSRKAMRRAGMSEMGQIRLIVLANRLVLRWGNLFERSSWISYCR